MRISLPLKRLPCALALAALVFGMKVQAAPITPVNPGNGEPNLTDFLDGVYGAGAYYRVDDGIDFLWTPGQISVSAIGTYTAALANLGYCVLCDGTDDLFSDQTFAGEGALATPITFGGAGLLNIASGYSWFNFAQFLATSQVYSDASLNVDSTDHAVTYGINGQPNTFILAFEDWFFSATPASDGDYQDFILEVTYLTTPPDFAPTPEPGALLTLAGGLAALVFLRRRALGRP